MERWCVHTFIFFNDPFGKYHKLTVRTALEQATEVYEALDKWKDVFNAQVALVPTLVIYAIDT